MRRSTVLRMRTAACSATGATRRNTVSTRSGHVNDHGHHLPALARDGRQLEEIAGQLSEGRGIITRGAQLVLACLGPVRELQLGLQSGQRCAGVMRGGGRLLTLVRVAHPFEHAVQCARQPSQLVMPGGLGKAAIKISGADGGGLGGHRGHRT